MIKRNTFSLRSVMPIVMIGMAVFLSCFDDDFARTLKYETLPIIPTVQDGSPVPGNGGLITNNTITTDTVKIAWTPATDDKTLQAELEYRAYRSLNNNITTPAQAEINGTPIIIAWTRDIATVVAGGLDAGTTYYFNVLVRDGDGNMAAYQMTAITTENDAVFMFPAGSYTGNLVAASAASTLAALPVRDAIDGLCATAMMSDYPALPCLNVRAFISISSSDDIAGMPANFSVPTARRVIGPTGVQIGSDWYDLLDGSIGYNLGDAGITTDHWWSGSLSDGTISASNCGGWTAESGSGQAGLHNQTNMNWIEGNTPNCNASRVVLCVCW